MDKWLESRIEGVIDADEVTIGRGVHVANGTLITGKHGRAKRVVLGDFCFVGENTKIICPEFILGDYSKLNANAFCHGENPLRIGNNCWFGGNVVLDSMGGLDIANNVGVGAHSQLWTHMQFGDVVEGCRFLSHRYMHVGEDVWFVGHCIVSPVEIEPRSLAMVGSVITSPMRYNRVYAGVPAKDMTDRFGPQFDDIRVAEKRRRLEGMLTEFFRENPRFEGAIDVTESDKNMHINRCTINVASRTYLQTYSEAEVAFFKQHVPLVKFLPLGKPDYFSTQRERKLEV